MQPSTSAYMAGELPPETMAPMARMSWCRAESVLKASPWAVTEE